MDNRYFEDREFCVTLEYASLAAEIFEKVCGWSQPGVGQKKERQLYSLRKQVRREQNPLRRVQLQKEVDRICTELKPVSQTYTGTKRKDRKKHLKALRAKCSHNRFEREFVNFLSEGAYVARGDENG